ncbi:hypothetical protein J31TS4_28560 [Paenibacillus sp. J31TS4]|nr:hypothetical protein J31TS4_28560 [Paenibacillus sp. J31TS4]
MQESPLLSGAKWGNGRQTDFRLPAVRLTQPGLAALGRYYHRLGALHHFLGFSVFWGPRKVIGIGFEASLPFVGLNISGAPEKYPEFASEASVTFWGMFPGAPAK